MILTKSDIINGKNNIQTIEFPELKGSLKLRQLTDGEYQKISNLMKNGGIGTLKTQITPHTTDKTKEILQNMLDIEIDPGKAEKARYQADIKAVYYSLQNDETDEKWSENDIQSFPPGTVEIIAQKVYEISGIMDPNTTRQQIEEFRPKK